MSEKPTYKPDPKGPRRLTMLSKSLIVLFILGMAWKALPLLPNSLLPWKQIVQYNSTEKQPDQKEFLPVRNKTVRGKLLLDEEYFYHLKDQIHRADESIWVLMYIFHLGKPSNRSLNPAYRLAQLLRRKARKGIEVKVALSSVKNKPNKGFVKKNRKTARFLRKAGVDVVVKPVPNRLHAKLVLIDEEKLYVANHNWTFSALKHNAEVAMYFEGEGIRSEPPARIKQLLDRALQS